jgi:hypothetical protein
MRRKGITFMAALAMVLLLGAVAANADQIVLGGTGNFLTFTSSGGAGSPVDVTGTLSSSNSGFFFGGTTLVLQPWSLTPSGTWDLTSLSGNVFTVNMNGHPENFSFGTGSNILTGTVNWTLVKDNTPNPQFTGVLAVASSTGALTEFLVGGSYVIDYTLIGVSPTLDYVFDNGGHTSGSGSSGEIPVPEPATLTLLGTGLFSIAGLARRKMRKG